MPNKKINIKYYAVLREQADKNSESIETDATTAKELYLILKQKYGFHLCSSDLKVAINTSFTSFDHELNDNDTVVFIPPVAGG